MALRNPLESLSPSLDSSNITFSPLLSLQQAGGFQSVGECTDENELLITATRKLLGGVKVPVVRAEGPVLSAPTDIIVPCLYIRISLSFSDPESEDDTSESDYDTFSPDEDEDDDPVPRAMAFAKYRAANQGMSAAMSRFNNAIQSDCQEVSEEALSSYASHVISSIAQSPPALGRLMSHLSIDSSADDDDLSKIEQQECDMVKAFIKRWAANLKLQSTHWQGTQPLPYKDLSIAISRYLTLYLAEQAIRNVSTHLGLAPPLEVDLPHPRLSRDPIHVGSARLAESGRLVKRPYTAQCCPMLTLERIRNMSAAHLNVKLKTPISTLEGKRLAGAKRAAGAQNQNQCQNQNQAQEREQNETEKPARRARWTHGPSSLRFEITAFCLMDDDEASDNDATDTDMDGNDADTDGCDDSDATDM